MSAKTGQAAFPGMDVDRPVRDSRLPPMVFELLGEDPRIGRRPDPWAGEWALPGGRSDTALWWAAVEVWESRVREVTRVAELSDVLVGTYFEGDVTLPDGAVVRVTYEPCGSNGWRATGDISSTGYRSWAGSIPMGLGLEEPLGEVIYAAVVARRAAWVKERGGKRG